MSPLTLTLKRHPQQRVDMSPLVCQRLQGLDAVQIGAIELHYGKTLLRVDDLFAVSGSDTQRLIISGSVDKLDFIGNELDGGSIIVNGDAGAYLGTKMLSGTIEVMGNTGIYAGCEMKNGLLQIFGNAGDFLGAALPGNKQGMKGGTILVKGDAGARVGDHMRRGQILIEGSVGDYCGSRMLAGTIAVMGDSGQYPGYSMRRGTLLFWRQPQLTATFKDCGSHTLAFLPLLFASFKSLDSRFSEKNMAFNRVRRFGGDVTETGLGEILIKI